MPVYKSRIALLGLCVLVLLIFAVPTFAQDDPDPIPVTDDEVNEVASQMYCPICEMEPLDTCGASTCVLWRQQIREELAAGRTSEEIIDSFIARYGDRVVGIPDDPVLRALSLFGPIVLGLLALIVGVMTFSKWRNRINPTHDSATSTAIINADANNQYLSQLENDLRNE